MVNKVFLIGRVGKDPSVKRFQNDGVIAEFPLATDDSYKNKQGEKVSITDWHNIKVSGKLAEVAEKYVKKGSLLHIEGKIKTRNYDDKDGNKRYVTEVVCESFKMLGDKDKPAQTEPAPANKPVQNNSADDDDSQLPF